MDKSKENPNFYASIFGSDSVRSFDLARADGNNMIDTNDAYTFDVGDIDTMHEFEPNIQMENVNENDATATIDPILTPALKNALRRTEYAHIDPIKISNLWAGPSFWKYPKRKANISQDTDIDEPPKRQHGRKAGKATEKILFTKYTTNDVDSDEEIFFDRKSKMAKKMKNAIHTKWSTKKLKLPAKMDVPKDLFDGRTYHPQYKFNDKENRPCNEVSWIFFFHFYHECASQCQ